MNDPTRILFLVGGDPRRGLDPSSRFRVFSYLERIRADPRFIFSVAVSRPAKSFHERPWFSRHPRIRNLALPPAVLLMAVKRLWDACRSPFYDVIFIQRPLLPGKMFPLLELLIARLNRHVIFDFDDAVFIYHQAGSRERDRPLYRLLEDKDNVARIIGNARRVIAGNDLLAAYARRYNQQVTVLPTMIDVSHFLPRSRPEIPGKPLTVGWIGTSANLAYVEKLAPVLRRLRQRFTCRLCIVCNPVTRPLQLPGVDYQWVDWSRDSELDALHGFDVGIMPLADEPWEHGKCGLKLLQYLACGIPAVASPVGVNARIISHGHNGFLADGATQWEDCLQRLLSDVKLRALFARRGREKAVEEYSLDSGYPRLARILRATAND